jgi:predicted phage tail protein
MSALPVIAGAFGGGGTPSGPNNQPDTLSSTQVARVLVALSEGPVKGLINDAESIFLNGTPLKDPATGQHNFPNVWFDMTLGSHDNGGKIFGLEPGEFGSAAREIGARVRIFAGETFAFTRTVNDPDVDLVGITLMTPRLYRLTEKGDAVATDVQFYIQRQAAGSAVWEDISDALRTSAMTTGGNVASVASNSDAARFKVRWRIETPDGPAGADAPVIDVEVRDLNGSSIWELLEQVETTYAEDRRSAFAWTYYQPAVSAAAQFRATSASGTVQAEVGEAIAAAQILAFNGKASSEYKKTFFLPLTRGLGPWKFRVLRISPDFNDQKTFNELWMDSYTEIIRVGMVYPYTSILSLQFDARTFSSMPEIGARFLGRMVRIPDGTKPWQGGFIEAWSQNPVWIWFDLATNPRYGLGEFITDDMIDIYTLAEIATWCNGLVPTGKAGLMEKRWTCNLYLQTREEAYRVLNNIASIFRGLTYYGAGRLSLVADKPEPVSNIFTAANVVDGEFKYAGVSQKTRHTVALVAWNDPGNMQRRAVVAVEDRQALKKMGYIPTEVIAVGCTSESQARRLGRHILTTERLEHDAVVFRTGLEAALVLPGDVIEIHDPKRAGKRMGGRLNGVTAGSVTLDHAVQIVADIGYELHVMLRNGQVGVYEVTNAPGLTDTLSLAGAPFADSQPVADAVWVLSADNLQPALWRVIGIKEVDGFEHEISAVQHNPDKFAEIDGGPLARENPWVSAIHPRKLLAPSGIVVEETLYTEYQVVKVIVTVSWQPVAGAARYWVRWSRDGSKWSSPEESQDTEWTLQDAKPGLYIFRLTAESPFGKRSAPREKTRRILGKTAPPPKVDRLRVFALPDGTRRAEFGIDDAPLDLAGYVIRYTAGVSSRWVDYRPLHSGVIERSPWDFPDLQAGRYTFAIRAKDTSGLMSRETLSYSVTLPPPRGSNVLLVRDSGALQWPGRTTAVDPTTGWLLAVPLGTLTYADLTTWDTWESWTSYDDQWSGLPEAWSAWERWAA